VVEIDHRGAADGLCDAQRGRVEVVERSLDARFETQTGQTFCAPAAPRFALGVLPLVRDVARQHD
jgi:hypothetical protein